MIMAKMVETEDEGRKTKEGRGKRDMIEDEDKDNSTIIEEISTNHSYSDGPKAPMWRQRHIKNNEKKKGVSNIE